MASNKPLTVSAGDTCHIETFFSSASLLMDTYEGWYTFVGSRIKTFVMEEVIRSMKCCSVNTGVDPGETLM